MPSASRRAKQQQQQHGARRKSTQRELERSRRRRVEPLDVVDCQQDRATLAEQLQHVADCDAERAMVDRLVRCFLAQQRDLERATPRHGEQGGDVGEDLVEEVAQADVCEAALGLRGPRHDDEHASLARSRHSGEPERRLADPRLAFEHEPGRPARRPADEGVNRGEITLPADDLVRHLPNGW